MWYSILLQFEQIKSNCGPSWGCLEQEQWTEPVIYPLFRTMFSSAWWFLLWLRQHQATNKSTTHHLLFSKKYSLKKCLGSPIVGMCKPAQNIFTKLYYDLNSNVNYISSMKRSIINADINRHVSANIFPSIKQPKKLQVFNSLYFSICYCDFGRL